MTNNIKLNITVEDEFHSYRYSTEAIPLNEALIFAARVITGLAIEGKMTDAEIIRNVTDANHVIANMLIVEEKHSG